MIVSILIILFVIGFFLSNSDEKEELGWEILFSLVKVSFGGLILVVLFFFLNFFGILSVDEVKEFIRVNI